MGERIRSLDMDEILEVMEGDQRFIKGCFHDFIFAYQGYLAEIRSAILSGSRPELEKGASSLRKILMVVSAHHATYLAHDLELLAKNGRETRIFRTFEALVSECENVRCLMEGYIADSMILDDCGFEA